MIDRRRYMFSKFFAMKLKQLEHTDDINDHTDEKYEIILKHDNNVYSFRFNEHDPALMSVYGPRIVLIGAPPEFIFMFANVIKRKMPQFNIIVGRLSIELGLCTVLADLHSWQRLSLSMMRRVKVAYDRARALLGHVADVRETPPPDLSKLFSQSLS